MAELLDLAQKQFEEMKPEFEVYSLLENLHETLSSSFLSRSSLQKLSHLKLVLLSQVKVKFSRDCWLEDHRHILSLKISPNRLSNLIDLWSFDVLEEGVIKKILPINPVVFFISQHRLEEMSQFGRRTNDRVMVEIETLLEKLFFIEAVDILEGELLKKHPIKGEAEWIDVTLVGVGLLEDELRSWGEEGADGAVVMQVLLFLEELLAESEVSDLENIVMDKDVGRLDVSVDDVISKSEASYL